MCGIAGIIGSDETHHCINAMLSAQKHRGPDATNVYNDDGFCTLGHNRLSIIDLSTEGNQPMCDPSGRWVIVLNGEIYNYLELRSELSEHSFRSHSDTEVLLAAYCKWGRECLSRLVGMFAFAIWDNREKVLFGARDRFGVKPFYYCKWKGTFLFASEIKSLWAAGVSRERNNQVWSSFFVYGSYGMPNETFWNDIYQLPAGHSIVIKDMSVSVDRWYSFEGRVKDIQPALETRSEEGISADYLELLNESIKLRFRADVRVGFNVSGGLDSSLLLSLINKSFPQDNTIEAFTFFTEHPAYNELPWVKSLMEFTRYPLHEVRLTPDEIPELAIEMSKSQDEPFGGFPTLAYSKLFKEARKDQVVVLLDGQGIDEAWAGYDYYQNGGSSIVQGISGSPVRPNVLTEEFRRMAVCPEYPKPFSDQLLDLQFRDLFFTKIPRALRFNDRASMMASTELREPFLDHRLIELAFALPVRHKVQNGQGKHLLRKIAREFLPDKVRLAPKRALQTPQREWLGHELQDWTYERICEFSEVQGVDGDSLMNEWHDYLKNGSNNSFYIWQFINSALLLAK